MLSYIIHDICYHKYMHVLSYMYVIIYMLCILYYLYLYISPENSPAWQLCSRLREPVQIKTKG